MKKGCRVSSGPTTTSIINSFANTPPPSHLLGVWRRKSLHGKKRLARTQDALNPKP